MSNIVSNQRWPRRAMPWTCAILLVLAGLTVSVGRAAAATLPYLDPTQPVATRVSDLLARMSLDEKIGQMTQAERGSVTPADITTSRLGSILSGGGSAPTPNNAMSWANMYDQFQNAALATPLKIPMIYGADAVHGHNNVVGATIYPHNIGLGATRNPALTEQIGRAVAEEVTGSGVDWTFAPCLCVARNDRWGRTYESFGEKPELAVANASIITGFQGATLGGPASILATAKHYIGDGGTTNGTDQGNTELSEADLRAIHLPPFAEAVRRGVGSVMISYSSWNGVKMHGNGFLINTVLKGELGFSGFVVSDWNAIDQLDGAPGFTAAEVTQAINAGIDMIMVPTDWARFISTLRSEVQAGRITQARIDDANRRILTKKFELGLFERPLADRTYTSTVGSAAHRALARQAVAQSQVLLKNDGNVLPLAKAGGKIFVAGKSADNIGLQSGGWTVSWQGASGATTTGTTILQGIQTAVGSGTTVTYNATGAGIDRSYRAAIAVVGETPYAEGRGDRTGAMSLDTTDLTAINNLRAAGVPVIVVLVSGRPMDIAAQLPNWNALVEAWLPGTEGNGVADVLFGDVAPTGKLPMTWMQSASQQPINDDDGKAPLFPYGFGLTYAGSGPDVQAPTAPTGLTGSTIAPTAVRLTWTAATDNVGVTGYRVFLANGNQVGAPSGTTMDVTGLNPDTAYQFYVVAADAAGNVSAPSATVTVRTPPGVDTSPPTKPGTPVASAVTSSSVTLSWTPASDNTAVTGYTVFREAGATDPAVGTTASPTLAVTGLAANTAYQFYVVAQDAAGNLSPASDPVSVTTAAGGDPGSTCQVTYTANNGGGGSFTSNVVIKNTGTAAVNGWTLAFTFPGTQRVQSGWSGIWSQPAGSAMVTVRNESWNGSLPAGTSVTIGFNGTFTGSNPNPTAFTLNGASCTN